MGSSNEVSLLLPGRVASADTRIPHPEGTRISSSQSVRGKVEDLDFLPARAVSVDRNITLKMKVKSSLNDKVSVELQILCIFQPKISVIKPQCNEC